MFKCHRCGKILVSKQAFTYHMNRKRPCVVTYGCECGDTFKTKFDLSIHRMHCETNASKSKYKVLMKSGTVCDVMYDDQSVDFEIVTQVL